MKKAATSQSKWDLKKLLAPKSVAVIGASERFESPGSVVILNMKSGNYRGRIYPINPRYESIHGIPAFKSISDLPEKPDCALICVNAGLVPVLLREAAEAGAGSAVIYASGFSETGESGATLQSEIRQIAETFNLPFCGPNCIGAVNFLNGFGGFSAHVPTDTIPGNVSAVCQSGSVAIALLNSGRGIHFRYLVSSGNEAAVTIEDYLEYLIEDKGTDVILGFVESFKNIPKLRAVAACARDRGKTIAVVKIGRTKAAQRTVVTHTGALAGEDPIIDAVLKQIGIIRARDLNELLETATLFRRLQSPKGNRVGMIAISGGEIGLLSDLSADIGLHLPPLDEVTVNRLRDTLPPYSPIANPVDAWGNGDLGETFQNCITAVGNDPGFDAVVVCLDVQSGMSTKQADYYAIAAQSIVNANSKIEKPLVVFSNLAGGIHSTIHDILDQEAIPVLQGTGESLNAIYNWMESTSSEISTEPVEDAAETSISKVSLPSFPASGVLAEYAAKAILSDLGIPVTRGALATTMDEAKAAAANLGYPVVLKIDSSDISHKSQVGGVALNVKDESQLEESYSRILSNVKTSSPNAEVNGVSVHEMLDLTNAVEVFAGLSNDPQCGPVVVFGIGGVYTEVLNDTSMRLAPLSEKDAHGMLNEIRGAQLLANADREAIVDVLLKLSDLAIASESQI
ncbi:MAG: acetate--CoA ligase family protein, partial [Verrucomicrobia bacterium]|nr:acetate--CoA ligase family protein [Verrucomicrobiota bacterium]